MLTLSQVKQHLRVDFDADDSLLAGYILSANNYMKSAIDDYENKIAAAGNSDGDTWSAAADLVQLQLIAEWYENRLPADKTNKVTSVNLIIQQLQHVNPKGYVE